MQQGRSVGMDTSKQIVPPRLIGGCCQGTANCDTRLTIARLNGAMRLQFAGERKCEEAKLSRLAKSQQFETIAVVTLIAVAIAVFLHIASAWNPLRHARNEGEVRSPAAVHVPSVMPHSALNF